MPIPQTAILGGGIIGLSLALELRQIGREVILLERDTCGDVANGSATVASAGMLGVRDPHNPPQLRQFAEYSFGLYSEFLQRIANLSGQEFAFQTTHVLEAFAPGSVPADDRAGEQLTSGELCTLEPQLVPGSALWFRREEPCLDPRQLCTALVAACRAAGVNIRENEEVVDVAPALAGVNIRTSLGAHHADQAVLTTGAWTARFVSGVIPAEPRRGQMLVIEAPAHAIHHTIRAPGAYLVPHADGRLLVGSTVERAGFDITVQATVMDRLQAAAAAVFPSLAAAKRVDKWAGLRPGSPDDLPMLGPLPQAALFPSTPRIFAATGHFRNGILLAPGTARAMAQVLQHRTPAISLAEFNPARLWRN